MAQIFIIVFVLISLVGAQYEPTWDSLDTRPLPQWYDDAKVGIFLHWGLFSVPSFHSEWFWEYWKGSHTPDIVLFMKKNYKPDFTYQDFGPLFTAELYDPDEWVDIFNASGAQYVVLTSKHHEGFTLWPSKYSWNWNALDVGPARDLLGDLASSIKGKAPHIHFGLYHSLYEWFNPLYLHDKNNSFQTNDFVTRKTMPELEEIVNTYKPEIIWSDGDWETQDWYWNSTVFLAWLFNESPVKDTVVVNDRWGIGIPCTHGSFFTCTDRYNPGVLQPHKWENAMTLDRKSWGFRREAQLADYLTMDELVQEVAETISCRGNILINAGPTLEGRIPVIMEERLRDLGSWLAVNGEAIYSSVPWVYQNDTTTPGVWYTASKDSQYVYVIVLDWPARNVLTLGSVAPTENTTVSLFGYEGSMHLMHKMRKDDLEVVFPPMSEVDSRWAWVLKMAAVTPA